jgi:hypothetical protein
MTRDALCTVLPTLAVLDADTAKSFAALCLLEWLAAEGYMDVVEAYLALLEQVEHAQVPAGHQDGSHE